MTQSPVGWHRTKRLGSDALGVAGTPSSCVLPGAAVRRPRPCHAKAQARNRLKPLRGAARDWGVGRALPQQDMAVRFRNSYR